MLKCFTRKKLKKYNKRNFTKRRYFHIKEHPMKYLSYSEIEKINCSNNEIEKYKKKKNINLNEISQIDYIKNVNCKFKKETNIKKDIISHHKKEKTYLIQNEYETFYFIKENYPTYYYEVNNEVHEILNVNILSKGFQYFQIGSVLLNPSREFLIFNIDFIGNRVFHFFFKHLYSNEIVELKLYDPKKEMISVHQTFNLMTPNNSEYFTWLDNYNIIYTINNSYYNNTKTYIYNIYNHKSKLLYNNKHTFVIVKITHDSYYNLLYDSDYNSDEIYIIDKRKDYFMIEKPFIKRKNDVSYPFLDHCFGRWYIHEKNKHTDTIKITQDFHNYTILYQNKEPTHFINDIILNNKIIYFILTTPRKNILYCVSESSLKEIKTYDKKYYISLKTILHNKLYIEYHSNMYNHSEQLNLETQKIRSKEKKIDPFIEKDIFINDLLYITLIYKKNLSLNNCKCVVIGYGSYGDDSNRGLCYYYEYLLKHNFLVVIAHIRGGGEFGYKGYNEGRLMNKKNTFKDFIKCIHYLFEHNYTSRDKLVIWGRSAGGLLISSVLNIEPTICKLAILGVPFVNVEESLKQYKIPLGFESHTEYGNPFVEKELNYIRSYDPIHHINKDGLYPNIFIYSNLNDTLVSYKQSLLYYEKMKELSVFKDNIKKIDIHIDLLYGHTQGSSLSEKSRSYAEIYSKIEEYL